MKNKILNGIIIVLGCFVLFTSIFYVRSNRPMRRAKLEAIELAKEYTDIDKVHRFYWFTRKETYFSLTGTNAKGKEIVVIIPESGEKVTVLNQKEGLTEKEVLEKVISKYAPNRIMKVNLGIVDSQATWEVVAENENKALDYYLVDFKTGKSKNILQNI